MSRREGADGDGHPMKKACVDVKSPAFEVNTRLYDQAARLVRFGAWECDLATEQLTWTDGVYDLFELPNGSALKRSDIVDYYVEDSRRDMELVRAEVIRTGERNALDTRIRTHRGNIRWMRLSVDVAYEDNRPVRLFGAKQDVTREKEEWLQLRRRAESDPLTGLLNRGMFDARYRLVAGDALNHGGVSALVLIDLDGFKQINDRLGHMAGDECLRQVSSRLNRVFSDATIVARLGGDEFGVLLPAPLPRASIRQRLDEASRVLRKPVAWNNVMIDIAAAIGAAILERPRTRRLTDLFAEADEALYAAKSCGRNNVRIFDECAAPNERIARIV